MTHAPCELLCRGCTIGKMTAQMIFPAQSSVIVQSREQESQILDYDYAFPTHLGAAVLTIPVTVSRLWYFGQKFAGIPSIV